MRPLLKLLPIALCAASIAACSRTPQPAPLPDRFVQVGRRIRLQAAQDLPVRTYDIDDFIPPPPDDWAAHSQAWKEHAGSALATYLRFAVSPEEWNWGSRGIERRNGASLLFLDGKIAARCAEPVHAEITQTLDELSKERKTKVHIAAWFIAWPKGEPVNDSLPPAPRLKTALLENAEARRLLDAAVKNKKGTLFQAAKRICVNTQQVGFRKTTSRNYGRPGRTDPDDENVQDAPESLRKPNPLKLRPFVGNDRTSIALVWDSQTARCNDTGLLLPDRLFVTRVPDGGTLAVRCPRTEEWDVLVLLTVQTIVDIFEE